MRLQKSHVAFGLCVAAYTLAISVLLTHYSTRGHSTIVFDTSPHAELRQRR